MLYFTILIDEIIDTISALTITAYSREIEGHKHK